MTRWRKAILIILLNTLVLATSVALAQGKQSEFPRPIGYVNDFAEVIEPEAERQIAAVCRELDEKTGAQIAVATFRNLGGDEIDGFANRLFEAWAPGQKQLSNGILIVQAVEERRVRIEVGYGLEPIIPDGMAGRIRREIMTPDLQAGRFGDAHFKGVAALASIVALNDSVTLESLKGVQVPRFPERPDDGPQRLPWPLIVFGLILLLAFMRGGRGRGPRGRGPFIGGPWIGGGPFIGGGFGGGGGLGGGGGFGGFGGGMSGGGGSSGGY